MLITPKSEAHPTEKIGRDLTLEIGLSDLVGTSASFLLVLQEIKIISASDANVLITGETGTGKDMCARAIHYAGPRADKPFIAINCGSVPEDLWENQFFGHERGAFTDARERSSGLLKEADGGTLFLDDVEALSPKNQVKLLRFLQTGSYIPLGGVREAQVNVRAIAATNENLTDRLKDRTFRSDLYFRLAVLTLFLPPLRERPDDIQQLAEYFLRKYAELYAKPIVGMSRGVLQKLGDHSWPGNIRELENVIHRAVVHTQGNALTEASIPEVTADKISLRSQIERFSSLKEMKRVVVSDFEREYVLAMLQTCGGNVSEAARRCHKNRRAFWELMRKYSITREIFRVR